MFSHHDSLVRSANVGKFQRVSVETIAFVCSVLQRLSLYRFTRVHEKY